MFNCHDDILAYHDEDVTLPKAEQDEMRARRDTNRQRLKDGLKRDEKPAPSGFQSQGSYAHRTMVQHPEKDYDIDDGVYFWKEDLKGPNGGDMSARDAKEMVRKALHDKRFKKPPEVRTNCVRIYYDAGYHVDVPVYRNVRTKNIWGEEAVHYEIASSDWKKADPVEVTRWFNSENEHQSPDTVNGRQLRRQTRMSKAFARSRESWRPRVATGFMITTLIVNECYRANSTREDRSLYETMVSMRDRLKWNLEIDHPTVAGEKLTTGPDDARVRLLKEKLDWAIEVLQVLFERDCTQAKALKAWDKVFNTNFFSDRIGEEEAKSQKTEGGWGTAAAVGAGMAAALLIKGAEKAAAEEPVDKRGGGRYA
ncbi:MAG: cyclic GMP-AMP synthase DncV-like nucleotidyltransferase [Alphaproteobacteria bacterium]